MEQRRRQPIHPEPRPEDVDVSGLRPAHVLHSELNPLPTDSADWERYRVAAEAELQSIHRLLDHDMQREAIARAAFLGANSWRGVHRRHESIGETVRGEASAALRRAVGFVATTASRVHAFFAEAPAQSATEAPDDAGAHELSADDATLFYTDEQLQEMRARVAASHRPRPSTGEASV